MTEAAKRVLRRRLAGLRQALPAAAAAARSRAAGERLLTLPVLAAARSVALYAAIDAKNELDLALVDAALRARGTAVYYPFLERREARRFTGFRRSWSRAELHARGQRFAEPPATAPVALAGELDVIVIPALGVAPDGHRLGYGAGWYDVTLPEFRPPAVAVAVVFDFQLLGELPSEAHDVAVDWVVTDRRCLDPRSPGEVRGVTPSSLPSTEPNPLRPGMRPPLVVRRTR